MLAAEIEVSQVATAAGATILAVLIGAWLTKRREQAHWLRESRHQLYADYVGVVSDLATALRRFKADLSEAHPLPVSPTRVEELVETCRPWQEKLEDLGNRIRMVASPGIISAVEELDSDIFQVTWWAQRTKPNDLTITGAAIERLPWIEWEKVDRFISMARVELGSEPTRRLRHVLTRLRRRRKG